MMSLINDQAIFLNHVCVLRNFAAQVGFIVTAGELFRSPEQQDIYVKSGKSRTENSMHLKRCAVDLNFFIVGPNGDFILCEDKMKLSPLGDYWESLDPKNRWGGNFKNFTDCPHFERKV